MLNKVFKFSKYIILTMSVSLCNADIVFAQNRLSAMKPIIVKYSFAMSGILFFSLILYIGLSIYNRFFVPKHVKNFEFSNNSFKTPDDKENAILGFIKKNRLR